MLSHVTSPVTPDPASTSEVPESPRYPLPAPDEDAPFTFGLTYDVAAVLAEHGYPPVRTGRDFVRLQQALFGFLYTPASTGAAASSLPSTRTDPGTPDGGREAA